ncbi:hypothetical protein BOX15_Mlig020811g3 [Macrostomum lignano]|uniref:DUF3456 domain-containing protein n=2 Tax=Macrostomum lignano TaxID=282301 RepID=A0A1I8JMN8_9PLAT|nr:hypothetical protein BOX15_Mlig020811g3 [Macrostomum lignano]
MELINFSFEVILISLVLFAPMVMCEMEESDVSPDELPEGMDPTNVPPGLKKFSFKTPQLSEEEQESLFFPQSLKCDGCIAVSYQIYTKFFNLYEKYKAKSQGRVKESDLLDAFEGVCSAKNDDYAVKEVGGSLRMVGPGLNLRQDEPGIIQGGGKMPARMRNLCHQFRGEIGEEELYEEFLKHPTSRQKLEDFLCRNKGQQLTGNCLTVGQTDRKKSEL